jgi:prepilin-type N-terminal cleavage/methylation domain-containing protein
MSFRTKKGFTLIEMAVVLLIISLILGAIFVGKSNLIQSGQTHDAMSIASDLSAAVRDFKARYHYLPGDFPINAANPEIPGVSVACIIGGLDAGNGNGLIEVPAGGGHPDETSCVPVHLFYAGYIKGGSGSIQTAFGSVRAVAKTRSNVTVSGNLQFNNVQNVIEFANLPCDVANSIDLKLDDGNLATGNVMASVASCTPKGTNDPVPFLVMGL